MTLTGLSRPTVGDLVERLCAAGLVESVGECGEDRRGPNARLYCLIAERAHVAGVDLRRTGLDVTVADLVGSTVGTAARRFDAHASDADFDLVAILAEAVAQAAGGPRRCSPWCSARPACSAPTPATWSARTRCPAGGRTCAAN